jgi:hypothetical protein
LLVVTGVGIGAAAQIAAANQGAALGIRRRALRIEIIPIYINKRRQRKKGNSYFCYKFGGEFQ